MGLDSRPTGGDASANFVLSAWNREAVLNYLMNRPWREVNEIIAMLVQLPPAPPGGPK